MALSTASTITPTSAKMPSHILATPTAVSSRQAILMPMAKTMFWWTMRRHLREMAMALAILRGSSSIRTMSAASMAASEPMAPIAMPMSARESTGASLMPSPTKASASFGLSLAARSSSTLATLSPGSRPAWNSSMPRLPATALATGSASPVSMMVFFTPARCSARMASALPGLTLSEMRMCPAYFPSMATCTTVPTLWQSTYSTPRRRISLALPAATVLPSTSAMTPSPLCSVMFPTRLRSSSAPWAFCRLLEIGWEEALSARAASSSSSASAMVLWWIPATSKTPWVRVPVLSKTTYRVLERVSRKLEPLTSTPSFEAPPMPAKKDSGIEITSAQGQLMTRKVSARYTQVPQSAGTLRINCRTSGGSTASASAE